jgi:protoporphyrinogen oxidase
MAQAATGAGVRIETGAEVETVELRRDGAVVRLADGREALAARVLSTLPLPLLPRLLTPPPPLGVVEAAAWLRTRAMVLVYVVHGGGRWTEYDAHYLPGRGTPITRISEPANYRVPGRGTPITRISEPANYRDSAEDPTDRTVLCVEIPCSVGDATWAAPDETLLDVVRAAVTGTGLPPLTVLGAEVARLPSVYPVYVLGFTSALRQVEAWTATLPSFTTLGRLGLFAHDNTHHALAMGYAAGRALTPGGGWDEQAWQRSRESFRGHVVED